jgi:hypothetical protein
VFEDVGTDPHPPTMELLGVAYQPPTSGGVTAAPDLGQPEGFVIRPTDASADSILLRVQFTDDGADVQDFVVRDLDSSLNVKAVPAAPKVDLDGDGVVDTLPTPDFFTGTSGLVDLENITFTSKQLGPHRLEVWAEDSHGSRSEKVTFTVQFEP